MKKLLLLGTDGKFNQFYSLLSASVINIPSVPHNMEAQLGFSSFSIKITKLSFISKSILFLIK